MFQITGITIHNYKMKIKLLAVTVNHFLCTRTVFILSKTKNFFMQIKFLYKILFDIIYKSIIGFVDQFCLAKKK